MVSLILFGLASIANAIMDTLKFHFESSPFRNLNPNFWNPNVSYKFVKIVPFTSYKMDAWHLIKSLMIVLIVFAIIFYNEVAVWYFDIFLFGFMWNTAFMLTYKWMYIKNV